MSNLWCCRRVPFVLLLLAAVGCHFSNSFVVTPRPVVCPQKQPITSLQAEKQEDDATKGGGVSSPSFDMYDSKIPPDLVNTIYEAESKTAAAQGRSQRVAIYAAVALVGFLAAFFNVLLTEITTSAGPDGIIIPLQESGFGWVEDNPVYSFFFLNQIGGGICLLLGGASGLLAEAELDSRRLNAEKIFEEMQRRRTLRTKESRPKQTSRSSKKRRPKKSLEALAELMVEEQSSSTQSEAKVSSTTETSPSENDVDVKPDKPSKDGLLGKVKDFYQKADTMAATQALLLNKKLEEEGLIEKITDESGLKVVGKEAASQVKKEEK